MTKNLLVHNSNKNLNSDAKFNVSFDAGHLLILDNGPFNKEDIDEEDMTGRLSKNLKVFYEELYSTLNKQKGEDEEKRDFDKAADCVTLPRPVTILPRAKPIPKPKPLTKWEKYRMEKGLPAKQKRSRMVYSELADDWVPRWGKGSAKNIQEKADWAIEEKPGMEGQDPFAMRKQEKNLEMAKQKKRELKNIQNSLDPKGSKKNEKTPPIKDKKLRRQLAEKTRLENEKSALDKTLEKVQKSTASLGKFDRKVKNEKEMNTIKKKKVDTDVLLNRKREKERDKNILSTILKKNK